MESLWTDTTLSVHNGVHQMELTHMNRPLSRLPWDRTHSDPNPFWARAMNKAAYLLHNSSRVNRRHRRKSERIQSFSGICVIPKEISSKLGSHLPQGSGGRVSIWHPVCSKRDTRFFLAPPSGNHADLRTRLAPSSSCLRGPRNLDSYLEYFPL